MQGGGLAGSCPPELSRSKLVQYSKVGHQMQEKYYGQKRKLAYKSLKTR